MSSKPNPEHATPTGGNACRFSSRHYAETLQAYSDSGYTFVNFDDIADGEFDPDSKLILLRHDIDLDPFLLPRLTEPERKLGLRSTIFLRVASPAYSLSTALSDGCIQNLVGDGFGLGLHYEPAEPERLSSSISDELSLLSHHSNLRIRGGSAHSPALNGGIPSGQFARQAGLDWEAFELGTNAGFKYISDSSRHWREGCFCKWINKSNRLHILTHPVWWKRGTGSQIQSIVDRL
jgi:hypothetical protein